MEGLEAAQEDAVSESERESGGAPRKKLLPMRLSPFAPPDPESERKTAERLLVEMPDRLPAQDMSGGGDDGGDGVARAQGEAHGALLALGYRPAEASRMLENLDTTRLHTEELIREALRQVRDR